MYHYDSGLPRVLEQAFHKACMPLQTTRGVKGISALGNWSLQSSTVRPTAPNSLKRPPDEANSAVAACSLVRALYIASPSHIPMRT